MKTLKQKRRYRNAYMRLWNSTHKESLRRTRKKYALTHQEKVRDDQRRKYLRWKVEKPDRLREIQVRATKNFYKNHPKIWIERYAKDREKYKLARQKFKLAHPERMKHYTKMAKARKRGLIGSYTIEEWESLKRKYNFTCPSCLKKEPEITLHADHVRPRKRGCDNSIKNIQPLCKPCNASKGQKYKKFPIPLAKNQKIC